MMDLNPHHFTGVPEGLPLFVADVGDETIELRTRRIGMGPNRCWFDAEFRCGHHFAPVGES